MSRTEVVVLGSINTDVSMSVSTLPAAGQTVLAAGLRRTPGGKGLNQAIAAARHGAATAMIACVGRDDDGASVRRLLDAEGVAPQRVRTVDRPTGTAVILVDANGENTIVVAPLANDALRTLDAEDEALLTDCAVLLCQLEVPLPTVTVALRRASAAGAMTVLNAAPAVALPTELIGAVDVLVVNDGEARIVAAALPPSDENDALHSALLAVAPWVIVTRGAEGAELRGRDGTHRHVPAPIVTAVDSTGAGDAFCGALAAALAKAAPMDVAVREAVEAGTRAVTYPGAIHATDPRITTTATNGRTAPQPAPL